MEVEKLEKFALSTGDGGGRTNCAGGRCPTIFKSSSGRFFVQGYVVPDEIRSQVELAQNETLVEVNLTLLQAAANKI